MRTHFSCSENSPFMSSTVSGTLLFAAMAAEYGALRDVCDFAGAGTASAVSASGHFSSSRPFRPPLVAGATHSLATMSGQQKTTPEIDWFFSNADLVQKFLVERGVMSSNIDLSVFLVVAQITVCMYIPFRIIQWLTFHEHAAVPSLDVPLTAEEQEENVDKKWVREQSRWRRSEGDRFSVPSSRQLPSPPPPQVPGTPFPKDYVPCYDPGNLQLLGSGRMPAMTPAQARDLPFRAPLLSRTRALPRRVANAASSHSNRWSSALRRRRRRRRRENFEISPPRPLSSTSFLAPPFPTLSFGDAIPRALRPLRPPFRRGPRPRSPSGGSSCASSNGSSSTTRRPSASASKRTGECEGGGRLGPALRAYALLPSRAAQRLRARSSRAEETLCCSHPAPVPLPTTPYPRPLPRVSARDSGKTMLDASFGEARTDTRGQTHTDTALSSTPNASQSSIASRSHPDHISIASQSHPIR